MSTATLSETLKIRIKPEWKQSLQKQAEEENLDISDIARRAIHEYMGRRNRRKPGEAGR